MPQSNNQKTFSPIGLQFQIANSIPRYKLRTFPKILFIRIHTFSVPRLGRTCKMYNPCITPQSLYIFLLIAPHQRRKREITRMTIPLGMNKLDSSVQNGIDGILIRKLVRFQKIHQLLLNMMCSPIRQIY